MISMQSLKKMSKATLKKRLAHLNKKSLLIYDKWVLKYTGKTPKWVDKKLNGIEKEIVKTQEAIDQKK